MKLFKCFVILLFITLPTLRAQQDFTLEEWKKLNEGEVIVRREKVNNAPWPKIICFFKAQADPLSSVAVFAAYEHQTTYIPKLRKAKISKLVGPTEIWVDYIMDMPWPLNDGRYTHGHHLHQLKSHTYQVSWFLVQSNQAKNVKGLAKFSPYPKSTNQSLVEYHSFIHPKSFFAPLFKGNMVKDLTDSIHAIQGEIKRIYHHDKSLLLNFTQKVTMALKGEYPYPQKDVNKK